MQGLLFKVNGVSATAPVYAFLSAAMLTLCVGFMAWWLAVVVVSMARRVPQLHTSRWLRAWRKPADDTTSTGGGLGKPPARAGGALRLLFTVTAPSSSVTSITSPASSSSWSGRPTREGVAYVAAATVIRDRTHLHESDDAGGAAHVCVGSGQATTDVTHVGDALPFVVGLDENLVNEHGRSDGLGDDEVSFATVNPLRAKRSHATRASTGNGNAASSASAAAASRSATRTRVLPPLMLPSVNSSSAALLVASVHDSDASSTLPGPVPATDRGRRVLRAQQSIHQ